MDQFEVDTINQRLKDNYGRDVATGLPNFRVAWSEYTEKRYGVYARFNEEGTYLRTEECISEEPKYIGVCSEKWVLEELKSTKGNPYIEMISPYSYEPVWVFGAANSNPNPIWRAVELLVKIKLSRDPNNTVKTASDALLTEEKRIQKEKERDKAFIQNESPYLAGQLHDGDAVVVPHNFVSKRQEE